MAGLKAIGSGLKTQIETISDIAHVYAPNELPNVVNEFPSAIILPGETTYDESFTNKIGVSFRILILISKQDNPAALNRLLDYMDTSGSDSVYAAIGGDTTLGGACDFTLLISCSGAGATTWGGYVYLSTEFIVRCYG